MRDVLPTFVLLTAVVAGCSHTSEPAPIEPEPDASIPVPDAAVDAEIDPPGLPLATLRCAPTPPCDAVVPTVTTFESAADLESRFIGGWRFCGAAHAVYGAGLEVASNHKVYVLEAAADGSCRRASGGGLWTPIDISEQNPPGTYQVTIRWFDGTFAYVSPTFDASGAAVDFGWLGGGQFNRLQPL